MAEGKVDVKFPDIPSRSVALAMEARAQGEGRGAVVRRSIGRPELRTLDPFLMLDEFRVGLPAGFPDHPHRGFETVSYMHPKSEGNFTHEDSKGNQGTLQAGDLQWMSAARGIMHSEVPESAEKARGLQLCINLPAASKMSEPNYQEYPSAEVTEATAPGVRVRVIAGESLGELPTVASIKP